MKKMFAATLMVLSTLFFSSAAFGQEAAATRTRLFKPFKVDVSLGFALPMESGTGSKGGLLFVVEPKYAVADQFALGLRLEGAAMARGVTVNDDEFEGDLQLNGSYLITGDYYLSNKGFRPFLGAGAGLFTVAGTYVSSGNSNNDILTGNKLGGMFRTGFEARHFRLGIEYNLVGKTDFSLKNNYMGFKLGICIGGGRYRK
jgi:hypothetical protein